MILLSERDLNLYERMAAELLHVAAELRMRQGALSPHSLSANRLEAYASAIDTNLRVEVA